MHRGHRTFLSACLGLLSVMAAQPTFGQGAPNQATFEQKLRPIPQALQGGYQGLPTLGAPARPEPSSSYRPASTSERAPSAGARSGGQHASVPASRPKAASAAPLPGCPAPSEGDKAEKPMVGFKVEFEFGSTQARLGRGIARIGKGIERRAERSENVRNRGAHGCGGVLRV